MTDEQLKQCCEVWQRRLRLRDWRIDVRFGDNTELDGNEGTCKAFRDDRLAIIRVIKQEAFDQTDDYYKAFGDTFDAERILIHEMLHIPFEGIFNVEAEKHEDVAQEQAINAVTNALYEAYSGGE